MMNRYLLAAILLVLSQCGGGDDYFLSPPLPPTAFIGEYYTTQFRILGLDNPVFKFSELPPWLKGYKDGTLAGTPTVAGSFPVRVFFSAPGCDSSRDIVVRVAHSVSSTEEFNRAAGVMASERFIVVNSQQRSFTYTVGSSINLGLEASHGKAPYTWNFLNLPAGLKGDKDGKVTGNFNAEGYYSFSASANDAEGNTADCYYTFNIQPAGGKNLFIQSPTSSKSRTATSRFSTTSLRWKNNSFRLLTLSTLPSRSSMRKRKRLNRPGSTTPKPLWPSNSPLLRKMLPKPKSLNGLPTVPRPKLPKARLMRSLKPPTRS